jgi:hypothetical protein
MTYLRRSARLILALWLPLFALSFVAIKPRKSFLRIQLPIAPAILLALVILAAGAARNLAAPPGIAASNKSARHQGGETALSESLASLVYLPALMHTYNVCPDFYDNFSDQASGWVAGVNAIAQVGYYEGTYRIVNKIGGYLTLVAAPVSCLLPDYVVSTQAHWAGAPGSSYGLLFGLGEDGDNFYLFEVNSHYQMYRVLRVLGNEIVVVIEPTISPAVNSGTAANYLMVAVGPSTYVPKLSINGTLVGPLHEAVLGNTAVGLVASGYSGQSGSDARFTHFAYGRNYPVGTSPLQGTGQPDQSEGPVFQGKVPGWLTLPELPDWPLVERDNG